MASTFRLRLNFFLDRRRFYSSILNPESTLLTSKQKTREALGLLKSEKNPKRIIDICRAASLNPEIHLDRVAFSLAISKLCEAKSFESIRSYLDELKSRPDLQNERFMDQSIVLYGQAGMLDHAIRSFKQMDELGITRSAKTLNALLFACILAKDYEEVNRIFMEFPRIYGIKPNLYTYNTLIKALCESGSSNSAYSIIAEMDRKRCYPNTTTFGLLLAGFYKGEKFEDVEKVLELMKKHGVRPGVSIYNVRIQSLCKLKRSAEAKALLEGRLSRGMELNSVTYCHLIHGFCREGDLEEAKRLFDEMPRKGCTPDSDCYYTLIHYLCQGKDFDAALKVCKESMEKDWVPNFTTMKTLVNGLASISKVDEARELVGQMKERFAKAADLWREIEEALPS